MGQTDDRLDDYEAILNVREKPPLCATAKAFYRGQRDWMKGKERGQHPSSYNWVLAEFWDTGWCKARDAAAPPLPLQREGQR